MLTLQANEVETGILSAAGTLPFLVIGLFVGAWVDRRRRRPILIAGDFGRGVIVGMIAALAKWRVRFGTPPGLRRCARIC